MAIFIPFLRGVSVFEEESSSSTHSVCSDHLEGAFGKLEQFPKFGFTHVCSIIIFAVHRSNFAGKNLRGRLSMHSTTEWQWGDLCSLLTAVLALYSPPMLKNFLFETIA